MRAIRTHIHTSNRVDGNYNELLNSVSDAAANQQINAVAENARFSPDRRHIVASITLHSCQSRHKIYSIGRAKRRKGIRERHGDWRLVATRRTIAFTDEFENVQQQFFYARDFKDYLSGRIFKRIKSCRNITTLQSFAFYISTLA